MKKYALSILLLFGISKTLTAQNVGIGTTTPTRAKLEVHGVSGTGNTNAIFGGDGTGISLQRNWPTIGFNQYRDISGSGYGKYMSTGYAAIQSLDPLTGVLAFDMLGYGSGNGSIPGSSRALSITQPGYVGIGGVTPNAFLQFPNTLNNRKIVLWETANNSQQFYGFGINDGTLRYNVDAVGAAHRFYAGNGSSSSSLLMTIGGDKKVYVSNSGGGGFLGINVDAAASTLHVRQAASTGISLQEAASGSTFEFRVGYTAATNYSVMYLRFNGSDVGYFRQTGEYVGYSDRRLKTNIAALPPTLAKVMLLQPKIFAFTNNNPQGEKTYGFIAQEVKQLFPELVFAAPNPSTDGIENPHAMSYSGIGVIAVKAIQEQQLQIDALKRENELLKARMDSLEKKLSGISAD